MVTMTFNIDGMNCGRCSSALRNALQSYFQKESVDHENTNGLVRQYLPEQSSFSEVTDEDCQEIMIALNTRSRKRLDWNTPAEVFSQHTGVALLN